jgi:hypothetical protein
MRDDLRSRCLAECSEGWGGKRSGKVSRDDIDLIRLQEAGTAETAPAAGYAVLAQQVEILKTMSAR